jgi:glycosyltransferase involved in cell wall biosynthesis
MKRLLLVPTGLGTGGAEAMLLKVLTHADLRGFDIQVISAMDEGTLGADIRRLGIPLTCLGLTRPVPTPSAFIGMLKVIRRFRPNVIQGWMYHGNLAAWLCRKLAKGTPALGWSIRHCVYDLANENRLTARLIKSGARLSHGVDATVYASQMSMSQHVQLGYESSRAVCIPNGFDLGRFTPSPEERRRVRAALAIPDDAFVFGHVGRLHPMKDHEGFLRAAIQVAAEVPTSYFVLAGRDVDTRNEVLARLAREAGIAERVMLLGERPDVPALMNGFDAFCLSSSSESFPNVVGEAAACGLPCIVTDVGAAPDIVGDSALVVPRRDPRRLAEAMVGIARLPGTARSEIGNRLRQRATSLFSIHDVAQRYARLWRALADGREPSALTGQ